MLLLEDGGNVLVWGTPHCESFDHLSPTLDSVIRIQMKPASVSFQFENSILQSIWESGRIDWYQAERTSDIYVLLHCVRLQGDRGVVVVLEEGQSKVKG